MDPGSLNKQATPPPRVLVVDDEPSVLKLIRHILHKASYEVTTCGTAGQAMQLLSEDFFDCIITDAIMPEMDGYELVKSIRKSEVQQDIPILMLTRKRQREDVRLAVEAGVTDYALKPIDEHLLLSKIELCLKKMNGVRHVFECPLHGNQAYVQLYFDAEITLISESALVLRSPVAITSDLPMELRAKVFADIGIEPPVMKFVSYEQLKPLQAHDPLRHESKFSFAGVPEQDLKKIRAWLHKEEIRRRK